MSNFKSGILTWVLPHLVTQLYLLFHILLPLFPKWWSLSYIEFLQFNTDFATKGGIFKIQIFSLYILY